MLFDSLKAQAQQSPLPTKPNAQLGGAQGVQSVQLVQPVPSSVPEVNNGLNSSLVDGAALTVVITGFIGIVKMVLPQIFNTVKQSRTARFAAENDSRQSELAIEAANAKTLQELLKSYSDSSQHNNSSMTEALVGQISSTLSGIVASQAKLVELVGQVSSTQVVIAETQRRTVEVLSRVEEQLLIGSYARDRRSSDWPGQVRPKRRLDLQGQK
jgi:hypothetical protein